MLRLIAALILLLPAYARAEISELRITKQPGIIYLAPIVIEQQHLIEKAGAKLDPDQKLLIVNTRRST